MLDRYLQPALERDLGRKILLITGPRQCGKTTLSRMLDADHQYLSHDLAEHRTVLADKAWDRRRALVIFDELHKMDRWKSWLKNIVDVEGMPPALVVTGNARLSAFRRVGDSLAGRHFEFRLHPLDLKEVIAQISMPAGEALERLMAVGGFPEPFLEGTARFHARWKRAHVDLILKEDLITLTTVRDIQSIETLIELLRSRIGSPVSASSLARDLGKLPNTVSHWLGLLEDLYVVFRVTPWHRNVALHYIRDKEGREVDFVLVRDRRPRTLIEVKWSDAERSASLRRFFRDGERDGRGVDDLRPQARTGAVQRLQVVGKLASAKSWPDGDRVEPAVDFLATPDITGLCPV